MIAFIICTNGYGHLRRSLLISNELYKKYNVESTFFFPKKKFKDFTKSFLKNRSNFKLPKLIDFSTETSIIDWKEKRATNWTKKELNLDKYSLIVSDNLIEILKFDKKAIIIGSFLWHHQFNYKEIFDNSELILAKYNPLIISNKYFTPDYMSNYKNNIKVGFNYIKPINNSYNKKSILIANGKEKKDDDRVIELINILNLRQNNNFESIFLEPRLYSDKLNQIFKKADFDEKMYSKISHAIIRPGLGTITDCISNNVRIISFDKWEINELNFNIECLKKIELIDVFKDNHEIIRFLENSDLKLKKYNKKEIDFNGSEETAKIIFDLLNDY